jgi:tRNA (guanine-N7-)-methyltransferase
VHPPGVGRLLLALKTEGLLNVRVSAHDAVEVLEAQIPDATFEEILILFPDPWHKKRHHKRRLIQPAFATSLARCLQPAGRLHLETDWEPYAEHMLQVLDGCAALENTAGSGTWHMRAAGTASDARVTTRFERRGERLGHRVFELTYRRR